VSEQVVAKDRAPARLSRRGTGKAGARSRRFAASRRSCAG
jgi:hypothetical protein